MGTLWGRHAPICGRAELTLTTSTCPNRRITLAGHRQPLGDLTHKALLAWLGYRRAGWPDTTNRHDQVSRISALGTRPVSPDYLDKHQARGVCLGFQSDERRPVRLSEAGQDAVKPLMAAALLSCYVRLLGLRSETVV